MPVIRRVLVIVASALVVLSATAGAVRAERCDVPEVPWVLIEFEGDDWLEALGPEILADLRPRMHRLGIAVCGRDDIQTGAPSARVRVGARGDTVSIVLSGVGAPDGIGRTVTFRMPSDSRALEVARNLQEALRATWEELDQVLELPPLDDEGRVLAPGSDEGESTARGREPGSQETGLDSSAPAAVAEVRAPDSELDVTFPQGVRVAPEALQLAVLQSEDPHGLSARAAGATDRWPRPG